MRWLIAIISQVIFVRHCCDVCVANVCDMQEFVLRHASTTVFSLQVFYRRMDNLPVTSSFLLWKCVFLVALIRSNAIQAVASLMEIGEDSLDFFHNLVVFGPPAIIL